MYSTTYHYDIALKLLYNSYKNVDLYVYISWNMWDSFVCLITLDILTESKPENENVDLMNTSDVPTASLHSSKVYIGNVWLWAFEFAIC